jgi:endonuclease YncB( thermonuclease family)
MRSTLSLLAAVLLAAAGPAFGQVVTVESRGTDRYGRTIGVVALPGGRTLNHEMVRSGLAWWYREVRGITA